MAVCDKTCIIYLLKNDTVGRVAKKRQPPCKMFQNDTLGNVGNNGQKKASQKEMARNEVFFEKKIRKSLHCLV
ncbi:hypothetical protein NUITMVRA1_16950 [Aerococcus viridans]|nr:hypothetical protein NUITMVRA1_16950 [Aerococcus viridans]